MEWDIVTMHKYIIIEKAVGETPLITMEQMRATRLDLIGVPLAYAGRLDPMASGKLLILIGDECKKQKSYQGLDKEYEFELLLGFSSDTGDVLGIADKDVTFPKVNGETITEATKKILGTHTLPYPHFSSKTVGGKPLFLWALENRLSEITIPTMAATIHRIEVIGVRTQSVTNCIEHILQKIELIPPVTEVSKALGRDFRRVDIRAQWQTILASTDHGEVATIATIRIIVSSGTYIRTLAPLIAKLLGTRGLAYSIHRTKIGRFFSWGPVGFWLRIFQ